MEASERTDHRLGPSAATILDIGEELNADLLDDLLDSVLNEIKAKQSTSTKDSDDQIMPTASPNIFETDLMDDLDTPFHNDDGETSFVSHKQSVLSHQDHGFSPDHFPNWSFDYVDELSRRSSFLESQCNQTVEQVNVSAYSYLEANRAGVSTDCEMTLESVVAAKSNLTSKENNSEQSDCHIPSQLFEYHGAKSDSSRTMDEDAKSNKNYHSLRHVPDFQALYTDQVGSHVCTNRANLQQLDDQVPSHHIQQSIHQAPIYQDENSNDTIVGEFLSWTCKHPENWNETEVLDWLFYSAERNGIDTTNLHGESFRVTGRDLCRMGIEDFQRREPQYGHYFYSWFRQLLNGLTFTHPSEMVVNTEPNIVIPDDRDVHRFLDNSFSPKSLGQGHHEADEMYYQHQVSSPTSPEQCYQYQQARNFTVEYGSVYPSQSMTDSQIYQGYDYPPSDQGPSDEQDYVYDYSSQSCQLSDRASSSYRHFKTEKTSVTSVTSKYAGVITPRRRPGRPRIKSLPTEEERKLRLEKKMKSQHLWEFIFDLLNNPVYNPQILKWENPKEGVFRFIQSEAIAGLWGNLKNNENMTYEKLSRAMRHYYKRGILERVEGRRLVYKYSSSTLKRMREKRMAAFQNSSMVATVSNVTTQCSGAGTKMNRTANDTSPSVPHSGEKQMVYMESSPDDVISSSGRMHFTETSDTHARPVDFGETSHFQDAMTSHDVTDLSDIGFHNPTGKQFIAGNPEMPKMFPAPTDLTMQNLENKRVSTLPYL